MTKKYLRSVRTMLSRRRALQTMATFAAVGCSGDDQGGSATDSGTTEGESTTSTTGGETTSTSTTDASSGTDSSTSSTSTTTTTTDATTTTTSTTDVTTSTTDESTTGVVHDECGGGLDADPMALLAQIETIVVVMMENRSFDHYFGARKLVEGEASDGLTGDEWNPDFDNNQVGVFKMDEFEPADPPHNWDPCHLSFNLGDNNGFVLENEKVNPATKEQVMGYHVREQIPALYQMADNFVLCDKWHASVMGPTWPNRFYLNCSSSNGQKTNFPEPFLKTIWHRLVDADVSSRIYFTDVPWVAGAFPLVPTVWSRFADGFNGFNIQNLTNPYTLEKFFDDAAAGQLPAVTFVDPGFSSNDDHPDHNIQLGQVFLGSIYKAMAMSPHWDRCLLVITYDEHGGFFDHVAPEKTIDERAEFQQLGFRVPTLVMGGTVRRGCVNSTPFEHASVLTTIAKRWNLPWLTERQEKANDLASCIHPDYVDNPQPAPDIAPLKVSISELLADVGKTTSQPELFEQLGVTLDDKFRESVQRSTLRLLQRAESLGVAILRP
ncbi:MAG: alkaline phosphatase family protein [Nannocystaceae bacterium]